MTNIIPFDGSKNLPAYLKKVNVEELNADLTSHAGGGFPVLSIKGKTWAVVRDKERKVLPNPKDPDSPATSVELVLIKASKHKSKVFYLKGYDPNESEGKRPDCYSNNGIAPEADSPAIQSKNCASCKHNQWGAKITENGKKGKACADTVRMAVAPAGQINDPMLLRVPPASLKPLGEYGRDLAKRGVGYNMVVTKVGFDPEAESPKLTFKPIGFLDDAGYAQVQEMMESDIVQDILGSSLRDPHEPADTEAGEESHQRVEEAADVATNTAAREAAQVISKSKTVTDDEIEGAVTKATSSKSKGEEKQKAKPPADDLNVDLEDIDFDDDNT